jgi:hypothetical protein
MICHDDTDRVALYGGRPLYWRLCSIPELSELSPAERNLRWRWYIQVGYHTKSAITWWTITIRLANGQTRVFNNVLGRVAELAAIIKQRCPCDPP